MLDPFCGSGTIFHAAENLGRAWIGIDVTHLAIGLIEKRLRDAFPAVQFTTHGVPQDIHAARDLAAQGKYHEFEKWAAGENVVFTLDLKDVIDRERARARWTSDGFRRSPATVIPAKAETI